MELEKTAGSRWTRFGVRVLRTLDYPTIGSMLVLTSCGEAMVLLAGQRTCDSRVAGSSPGGASLHSGLGQAT